MRRTELPPAWSANSTVMDVTFEDVRQSFLIRLHSEEARLVALRVALKSAQADPVSAFVDLEIFAHRLRGAAAMFDLPQIRDAAKELELAAALAATDAAYIGEPFVQEGIRILATRLSCLNGLTLPSSGPAHPLPAN